VQSGVRDDVERDGFRMYRSAEPPPIGFGLQVVDFERDAPQSELVGHRSR
jgi:hypothetical protein